MKDSFEKRQERISGMIKEFKLEGTENTYIGGPMKKGISGGERKRVNICLEMIGDPPILFLDEPTSGLDSYTSEIVIQQLKDLAVREHKTIVYVVHQPSSDIFRKMDKLMLLSHGKLIYTGKSGKDAVDYFSRIGFPCDTNTNPSDYFMYIMQSKVEGLAEYLHSKYDEHWKGRSVITSTKNDPINVDLGHFPGIPTQLAALLIRAFKLTVRNPASTVIRLVQVIFMSFFYCSIYFQLNDDPKNLAGIFNRNGALFFLCAANFIPALMSQLIACKFLANL